MNRGPTWGERARAFIAALDVPETATLAETRRLFRANGWRFHGGTYWGRRAWGKATRAFQQRRGLLPAPPMPLLPSDIIFPFRDKGC